MKSPEKFEEYLKKGVVKKQSPDVSRAGFLIAESRKSKDYLDHRLKNEGVNELNANSLSKDSYDIILSLIRAKMCTEGYSAAGFYAHGAEVSYLRNMKFSENDLIFLNELRYNRNGVIYYGKIIDSEYANKIVQFLNRVYPILKNLLK